MRFKTLQPKTRRWIIAGSILAILILVLFLIPSKKSEEEKVWAKVKSGDFLIDVTTTGELEAKSSELIYGPQGLRSVQIWQVKISDIIADGTVVDSGAYVATLDRTEISNKMKDVETELDKLQTQITKTKLDTTLEMRGARDELVNLKYALEEKKIILDQSKYEPPASIRQAEIDLEKSDRAYKQAEQNYKLKLSKARANMSEVMATYEQAKRRYESMMQVVQEFTIKAPKAGMVIYKRDWDGKKVGPGSTLSAWENVVATLPNLSKMISKTYVNEIDISKIKPGQIVSIGVDAFPEKKFTGKVTEVANIGEQMRGTNTKVFEVRIVVNEFDSILRPAMTTKNMIHTAKVPKVMFVPIESVHQSGKISYVYKKSGNSYIKQQVLTGVTNENEIIIKKGLEKEDQVLLNPPADAEDYTLRKLD
jgi:HlyD family secretion protein